MNGLLLGHCCALTQEAVRAAAPSEYGSAAGRSERSTGRTRAEYQMMERGFRSACGYNAFCAVAFQAV